MIINHNISTLDICNNINKNNRVNSKAINRLSSGLRINSAADDSAGLGISQGMRAQIRGLDQAERNIQDGISLLQTAEGGLEEIENPNLQRMRELAVQAANETLTSEDREIIQKEIDQIKNSINDIANNTEFNEIKVLRPPISQTPPTTASGKSDIVFIVDVSGSMGGTIDNVIANLDGFVDKLASNGVDFNLGLVSYSDTANGEPLTKWNFTTDSAVFKNNMITMRGDMLGGGDTNESGLEGIKDPTNGALSLPLRSDAAKQFILVTDAPVHDNSVDGDSGDGRSTYDIDDVASELFSKNIKLTVVGPLSGEANTQLKRLSDPTGGSYLDIYGAFSTQLDSLAENIVVDSGTKVEDDKMSMLNLQIGSNSGDVFQVELFDARTPNLGVDDVIIDPFEEAKKAIDKIDKAIELASSQRAKFGVYQNALEHIESNVGNYSYNITSAESRISDTDMAKEVMEMSKSSIIEQSAQSILKQAEKMPQSIIDLMSKWQG